MPKHHPGGWRRSRAHRGRGRPRGPKPGDVRLIAVSKTLPIEAVAGAPTPGQRDFGENKVQEALQKIAQSADTGLRWHLIGHLQSNKAKESRGSRHSIHAIDSVDLLRRVDQAAPRRAHVDVLIQVDLALEDTKFGARRRGAGDFRGGRRLQGGAAGGPDAAAAAGRKPGRRAALVRPAPRRCAIGWRTRACRPSAARTVDGHEPRFRGGHRRRRDDGAGRNGDFWREALQAMKVTPLDLRQAAAARP